MAGPGHTYQILGQHTYADAGAFLVRVTLRSTNGTVLATTASTAVADEQGLSVTAASFTIGVTDPWNDEVASTGLHNAVVATFTDGNPLATSLYGTAAATISWGDGYTDRGTVLLSNGTFYVLGSHHYTTPGVFTTRVTLDDDGTSTVAEGTVTVLPATAGRLTHVTVPNVHNANPFEWMLFTELAWGDSTPPVRTYYGFNSAGPWQSPPLGTTTYYYGYVGFCPLWSFVVASWPGGILWNATLHGDATHVYAHPGTYHIAGTARYTGDDVVESDRSIAVADGSLSMVATLPLVAAQEGKALSGVTLVTFADEDPLATGFSARIAWGDGTESDGQIAANPDGTFGVAGGHTYQHRGNYPIVVVISHAGTASVAATTTAVVRADLPPLQGQNIGALAGYPTGSIPVATFNDPLAQQGDFSASINWGDGMSGACTISQAADGTFRVYGNHTYAAAGSYPVRVTLTAAMAGSATSDATATVLAWSLTAQERTEEPEQSQPLAINQAAVELNTGGLLLTHPLDFDQSPGTSVGGNPALVYNSNTIAVRPVVELNLGSRSSDPVPSNIQVQLAGDAASLHTFATTGHVAGDDFLLGAQLSQPATFTGQVTRTAHVHIQFATGLAIDAEVSARGPEVVRDILTGPQADALGAGWGIAGVDRLFFNCDGVSWVTGSGDSRFFKDNGDGTYTSPPEDFGNLVQLPDFSFVYSAKDLTHLLFDKNGLLRRVVDRDSLALVYDYDTEGRLKTVTAPDGSMTTLLYSPSDGLLTTIIEPGIRLVTVTHLAGNLTSLAASSVTEGPGGENLFTEVRTRTFGYDGKHHLTRDQWAPLDTGFHYAADTGRLDRVDRGLGTSLSIDAASLEALHNPALHPGDGLATVTDARNNATRYQLDALGRLLLQRSADDTVQTWQRNSHGQVTAYTDGLVHTTAYQYDAAGDLRQIDYPDASYVTYDYHPLFHTVTRYQDGRGNVTLYGYNVTGDVVRTEDAMHEVTTQLWLDGLLRSITDPALHTTRFEYDGQRRVTDTIDALQNRTTLAYDTAGNVLTTEDALHRVTTTVYDGRNLLVRRTDAAGGLLSWDYSAAGLLVQETDARNIATTYAYDIRGLLAGTTEGIDRNPQPGPYVRRRSERDYDAAGNLQELITGIAIINEQRTRTRYEYDALNRATDVRRIDWYTGEWLTTQTAYDAAGNVVSVTAPNQVVTSYAYDARNRLTDTFENWKPGAGGSLPTYDRLTHRFYDPAGNLRDLTTGLGGEHPWPSTTHYEYDALNRVSAMTEASGTPEQRTTTYAYDAVGNLAETTSGLAGGPAAAADYAQPLVNRYDYDDVNRRVRIEQGWHADPNDDEGGGFADRVTTMAYDKVGNLLSVRSGLSDTTPSHASLTSYAYDALNQRTQIYEGWAPSLISGLPTFDRLTINSYDAVGNLMGIGTGLSTNYLSHVSLTSYAYDALGRRTDEWDGWLKPEEVHSQFVYDSSDNLIDVTTGLAERNPDPLYAHPSETHYTYDGFNRRTGITQMIDVGVQQRTSMAYDAAGNLRSTTRFSSEANDARQIVTSYGYDALNRRTTTIEAWHAPDTGWAPPGGGPLPDWLIGIQRTTTSVYDNADQRVEETTGQTLDSSTNLPVVNRYAYDHLGRLTSQTLAANWPDATTTTMAYDAAGNLTSRTTGLGSLNNHDETTHYDYDTLGQLLRLTEGWGDPDVERSTEFLYDGAGNLTERIDPLQRHTRHAYDSLSRQTAIYENDRFVNGVEQYDRLTTMVYDAPGNLIYQTTGQAPGQPPDNPLTTHALFDALNRQTVVYEAWGLPDQQRHTAMVYDAAGNVRRIVRGLAEGNDAYAHPSTTNVVYDLLNRPIDRIEDLSYNGQASSRTFATTYDGFGNVRFLDAPDMAGNGGTVRTTFTYDPLGRLVDQETPPAAILNIQQQWVFGVVHVHTLYAYNAADDVVRVTDPMGHPTINQYDHFHHVVQTTDALSGQTSFVYDRAGNRLAITDPDHNTTTFSYDKLNQLIAVQDPMQNMSYFYYDPAGRLEHTKDRLGRERVLHYDGLDHLTREEWFAPDGISLVDTLDYTYDAANNLRTASNSQLAYTFVANALHQVTDSSVLPNGTPSGPVLAMQLHFTFDAAGNRTGAEEKNLLGQSQAVVASQYDAANRLRQRRFQGQGEDLLVLLDYTKQDQLKAVTRLLPNPGNPTLDIDTGYTYDDAGRLLNIDQHLDNGGQTLRPLSLATYLYDVAGRLKQDWYGLPPVNPFWSSAWTVDTHSYEYDTTNQLTNDGQAYHYDANGNRTDGTSITTGNQVQLDAKWLYDYDAEGNLRKRTSRQLVTVTDGTLNWQAASEVWTYRYDHRNRLVEVRRETPTVAADGTHAAYQRDVTAYRYGYDAFGNRVWSRQDTWTESLPDVPNATWTVDANSQRPVASMAFAYDGQEVWRDKDVQAGKERRYLRGDAVDQVYAHVLSDNQGNRLASWYLTDRQNSVRMVLNEQASVMGTIAYDSFGAPQVPDTWWNHDYLPRYGYSGREYEPGPKLQYNRARFYDPVTGRWLSQDPLGFGGGDTNLYRYAGNSPTNATDPEGTTTFGLATLGGLAVGGVGGFVYGGLSGKQGLNGFDADRALAGFYSGAMVGAGLGLMVDAPGVGLVLGGALVGAGVGSAAGGGLFTPGQSVEWVGWSTGAAVGAASGAVGGGVGLGAGALLGTSLAGMAGAGLVSGLASNVAGQGVGLALGAQQSFDVQQLALAGLGGAAGGALAGALTRGMMNSQGLIRCEVGLGQWLGTHALAGGVGGFVGDAADQAGGLLSGRQSEWSLQRSIQSSALGALTGAAAAYGQYSLYRACFAGDTQLLTPEGSKRIQDIVVGDWVLSRDEFDPNGPVVAKQVEEVFMRVAAVLNLHVGGKVIRTTAEHPFWEWQRGWVRAGDLRQGDYLLGHDGRFTVVEALTDGGEVTTVYNLRVAGYHTYFVGCQEWGFSVWAHNAGCTPTEAAARIRQLQESLEEGIGSPQLAKGVAQELRFLDTFVSGNFEEVQHVTPGRGTKPAVTRTVYKNTEHFDGGVPAFVEETPGAVHAVVKAKLAQGYSNKQLMEEGYAPIGKDGQPINLHHLEGTEPGPMIELMQSVHQDQVVRLHDMIDSGAGVQAIKAVQRRYERWADKWWQQRARDF